MRKARQADHGAQQRGEHDAERGNAEGVGDADGEGPQIGVGCAVGKTAGLSNLEARFAGEEGKAGGDLALVQIAQGIGDEVPGDECDRRDQGGLVKQRADVRVV
jgi:hypothetical protein